MLPPEIYGAGGALAVLAFLVAALIRGDLVPGYVYRQERDARKVAETQAERNTHALDAVAQTVKTALDRRADG